VFVPHVPATQVRHEQLVSVPGQSVGAMQSTQTPLPSHILAPPHDVRAGAGGFEGTPAVQTSDVQALPSTGKSVLSMAGVIPPIPLHSLRRQSPAVWAMTGVPAALLATPHALAAQVRVEHSVSDPGQLAGATHCTHCPLPSQTVPPPCAQGVAMGALEPLQILE
jgi:hypothetical protein